MAAQLPREAAISLLRDSCLGKRVPLQESVVRAAMRRAASAPLPLEAYGEDEWAAEMETLVLCSRCHST